MRRTLSKSEKAEINQMLTSGKSNSDIAQYLNISQATVYNYKSRLIKHGFKLPAAKRGRKPKSMEESTSMPIANKMQVIKPTKSFSEYRFIINNVSVRISGKAKDVIISADEMRIHF